jgi:hypothetical protein
MMLYPLNGVSAEGRSQVLWKDGGGVFCREYLGMKVTRILLRRAQIVRAYVGA